jgi:hypothetical protein
VAADVVPDPLVRAGRPFGPVLPFDPFRVRRRADAVQFVVAPEERLTPVVRGRQSQSVSQSVSRSARPLCPVAGIAMAGMMGGDTPMFGSSSCGPAPALVSSFPRARARGQVDGRLVSHQHYFLEGAGSVPNAN